MERVVFSSTRYFRRDGYPMRNGTGSGKGGFGQILDGSGDGYVDGSGSGNGVSNCGDGSGSWDGRGLGDGSGYGGGGNGSNTGYGYGYGHGSGCGFDLSCGPSRYAVCGDSGWSNWPFKKGEFYGYDIFYEEKENEGSGIAYGKVDDRHMLRMFNKVK